MVAVVVHRVVVDRQEVAVVVGVEAISRVVVHLVVPPVSLLVAWFPICQLVVNDKKTARKNREAAKMAY